MSFETQAQIIQNGSFENTLNNYNVSGEGQFKDLVSGWTGGNLAGSPDLYSINSSDANFDIPKNISTGGLSSNNQLETAEGDNYAGIQTFYDFNGNTTEYLRTSVSLNTNSTYRIKFKFSCAFTAGYFEKIGVVLSPNSNVQIFNKDFITPDNSNFKLCSNENLANYNGTGFWYEFTSTFHSTTAGVYALFIGSFKEQQSATSTGRAGELSQYAYYLIDDVSMEVITIPCCPVNACYTNTSSLPSLTLVSDFIKAGNAEGCFASNNGPVTVTSGQNVVFRAGSFIEIGNQEINPGPYSNIAGMDIQQGATFDAYIDGCSSSNFTSVPPINIISVPNLFIRGLPNPFYIVYVENALIYTIEMRDNEGVVVLQQNGTINSNKAIIMIPPYIPTANYVTTLTFSNCNSSITLNPFWLQILQANARESSDIITINENTIKDDTLRLFEEEANIHIFPNPAQGHFIISSNVTIIGSINIVVFDLAGRTANTFTLNGITAQTQQIIDINKLAKGIYFVKINSDGSEKIEKLIVR